MRPADAHLNPQEFELLLPGAVGSDHGTSAGLAPEAQKHLDDCSVCRSIAEKYRTVEEMLTNLQHHGQGPGRETEGPSRGNDCPAAAIWLSLAAGVIEKKQAARYRTHAAVCDRCGSALRKAAELLSDDLTAEEEEFLEGLESATPAWQQEMSRRLLEASAKPRSSVASPPRKKFLFQRFERWPKLAWVTTSLAVLLLTATAWLMWMKSREPDTDRILAETYSEHRTIELRILRAHHSPPRVERGARTLRPVIMVEAESLIRRKLERQPKNPSLLQSLGRVELLDWKYLLALDTLNQALDLAPDSSSVRIDLASAYFERAEDSGNQSDYHKAIELLGQVLQKNPDDSIALFNRAIVGERVFAYRQAAEDWNHYLQLCPNDDWSQEAKERLDELKKKISEHDRKVTEPLLEGAIFVRELEKQRKAGSSLMDLRIEEYQQRAIKDWFAVAMGSDAGVSLGRQETRSALEALSNQMSREHDDYWFHDMLQHRVTAHFRDGLKFLREAILLSGTDEAGRAEASAQMAIDSFSRDGSFPGIARAEAEKIYAFQIQLKYRECLDESRRLLRALADQHYGWLQTQIELEEAICANGSQDFNFSQRSIRAALVLARQHHFPTLEQRVLGTDAFNLYDRGLEQQGLERTTEGLRLYWRSASPPARGFQFYWNLFSAAETKAEWHLAVVFGIEAVHEIALTDLKRSEASSRAQLALVAAKAGAATLARAEAERAQEIVSSQVKDPADSYLLDLKIARAEVELKSGNPTGAMDLLKQVKPALNQLTHYAVRLRYYATLGNSALRGNLFDESAVALDEAVRISDASAPMLNSVSDRLAWQKATAFAYRTAVELRMVRGDYAEGLALWEKYKSIAGFSGPTHTLTAAGGAPVHSVGIVWALLPDGLATWVQTPESVYGVWSVLDEGSLEERAREFTQLCTSPTTSFAEISGKSRQLYRTLFSPIAPYVREGDLLVVDADGVLAGVPISVLENGAGTLLIDSHPILNTLSLKDYLHSGDAIDKATIGRNSNAIIVSSRTGTGAEGEAVVYNAGKEAKMVAAQFSHAVPLEAHKGILAEVKREMPRADVFHFVGHSEEMRGQIGLVLWSLPGQEAEIFTPAKDIPERLRLKLAVLSACSTGQPLEDGLLDANGLIRNFLSSGTTAVVATGWSLDSEAAARSMDLFYSELTAGSDVPHALRQMQLSLRQNKQFAHPYYWATFESFA